MIQPALSAREALILAALEQAAERGLPCPDHADLNALIACTSTSTSPTIVRRLEEKGYIVVERFQRSRQVRIVATGKMTQEPKNKAPHWRDRPRDMPTPSRAEVERRAPTIAAQIFAQAARMNKPVVEYLADLVFVGWEVERDRG